MYEFALLHLASIGLILDMIGVSILFFIVVEIGEQVILLDKDEEQLRIAKKRKKEVLLRIGYVLILAGFLLQLMSNERKN